MGDGEHHRADRRRAVARRAKRAGLTLLEAMIAVTIVSTILLSAGGAFLSSLSAADCAQRTSRATVFLETVMQDLSAQPYDALTAFDGDRFFDQGSAAKSNYAVDLRIFLSAVDLLQVDASLIDLRTNQEIGHLSTLRARR